VRLRVPDIEETTKEIVYDDSTSELNPLLEHGPVHDFEFVGPANVQLRYYRAGQEIFLDGEMRAGVIGQCARCLESFEFTHAPRFSFIMVPHRGRWAEEDLAGGGGDLTWYEGEEIDVSPMLRERMLLALPTLPLCREGCRGLCAQCGCNLNAGLCDCVAAADDPRFAVLRTLKRSS
jgi:DUF177 domain-containing protein